MLLRAQEASRSTPTHFSLASDIRGFDREEEEEEEEEEEARRKGSFLGRREILPREDLPRGGGRGARGLDEKTETYLLLAFFPRRMPASQPSYPRNIKRYVPRNSITIRRYSLAKPPDEMRYCG